MMCTWKRWKMEQVDTDRDQAAARYAVRLNFSVIFLSSESLCGKRNLCRAHIHSPTPDEETNVGSVATAGNIPSGPSPITAHSRKGEGPPHCF
jgi:hypothetical protein